MGSVYRAWDSKLERYVALKSLNLDRIASSNGIREQFVKRFVQEAKVLAKLDHPNIVPVYDIDAHKTETRQHPFMVLKYIEGQTLEKFAVSEQRNDSVWDEIFHGCGLKMSPEESRKRSYSRMRLRIWRYCNIICKSAAALQYLHWKGVIHRDIKPQNIMIGDFGNETDAVFITDFGIAKLLDGTSLTKSGFWFTPAYAAPELIKGTVKEISPRTDIYSLGATFYFLLTGRLPFEGSSDNELYFKILKEEPVPPSKLNRHVSSSLDKIVMRAMAKKTDERYARMVDFGIDIRDAQDELEGKRTQ